MQHFFFVIYSLAAAAFAAPKIPACIIFFKIKYSDNIGHCPITTIGLLEIKPIGHSPLHVQMLKCSNVNIINTLSIV